MGDAENEAVVLNNMGIAFNYAGLCNEAVSCLQRAIALARPEWKLQVERKALSNLAQSYLALEQLPRARVAMQQCMALRSQPIDAVARMDHTICEFTFTQVALDMGENTLARQHADRCAIHGYAANSVRCKIMANIAQARCDVREGNCHKGLAALEQSLVASRDLDSSHSDALIAIVKAYDEVNQAELALKHMTQLLEHANKNRIGNVRALLEMVGGAPIEIDLERTHAPQAMEHRLMDLRAKAAKHEALASRLEMFGRLAAVADLREDNSGEHGYRVGTLSALLAIDLGWAIEDVAELEQAARLHDLGKIGIPDRILGSSERLKGAEREFMRMHTIIGAELLSKSEISQLKMAGEIANSHHEWWNGGGYPNQLAGDRIPIHARIVALADVFDALTHGRPFDEPWNCERAAQEIRNNRGTQFDPALADRFLKLLERLHAEHGDVDTYLAKSGLNSRFMQVRNRVRQLVEGVRGRKLPPLH